MKLYVDTIRLKKDAYKLRNITRSILNSTNCIQNISETVNSIGLNEIKGNLTELVVKLRKQSNVVDSMSDALVMISQYYDDTEELICSNNTFDFWDDDSQFDDFWYTDNDKLCEAYTELYNELKQNGKICLDDLLDGTEERPNRKLQLIQYLLGAEPTGVLDEHTFNMLLITVEDFDSNGHCFSLKDFYLFGVNSANKKWDKIFGLMHSRISDDIADEVYKSNDIIEHQKGFPHSTNGNPSYLEDQNASYLDGMCSNSKHPDVTSANETFCENIAIYNAMEYYNPGAHETLSQIVYDNSVNKNFMGLPVGKYRAGGLGVDPYTIPETMESYGYSVTEHPAFVADAITPDKEPVVIVSSLNSEGDITDGIHTYCLTQECDGNGNIYYVEHNAYGVSGKYSSVGDFAEQVNKNNDIEIIEIIGISN